MSIPETLLAAVCLLVTCSGIAVMAEDWRDTASANRAAAEFTVTARRAAAWVLSRRADLAEKAEHAPFSQSCARKRLRPGTASQASRIRLSSSLRKRGSSPSRSSQPAAPGTGKCSGKSSVPQRAASKRAFSWQKTAFLSGETKSSAQPLSVPDAALFPQPCPPVPGEPSSPFPKAAPSPPCRQTASFPVLPYPEEKKRAWTRRSA